MFTEVVTRTSAPQRCATRLYADTMTASRSEDAARPSPAEFTEYPPVPVRFAMVIVPPGELKLVAAAAVDYCAAGWSASANARRPEIASFPRSRIEKP